jgi:hypothetical protein
MSTESKRAPQRQRIVFTREVMQTSEYRTAFRKLLIHWAFDMGLSTDVTVSFVQNVAREGLTPDECVALSTEEFVALGLPDVKENVSDKENVVEGEGKQNRQDGDDRQLSTQKLIRHFRVRICGWQPDPMDIVKLRPPRTENDALCDELARLLEDIFQLKAWAAWRIMANTQVKSWNTVAPFLAASDEELCTIGFPNKPQLLKLLRTSLARWGEQQQLFIRAQSHPPSLHPPLLPTQTRTQSTSPEENPGCCVIL